MSIDRAVTHRWKRIDDHFGPTVAIELPTAHIGNRLVLRLSYSEDAGERVHVWIEDDEEDAEMEAHVMPHEFFDAVAELEKHRGTL